MGRTRPKRTWVTVRIAHGELVLEETFQGQVDADHWRQMVEETLAQEAAKRLDLAVYAHGLAESVREAGGPFARQAWLDPACDPKRWAQGLVLPPSRELTDAVLAMLQGQRRG
jgi:hypothetical protein